MRGQQSTMVRPTFRFLLGLFTVVLLLGGCASGAPEPPPMGAFRFEDGTLISIRRSLDGTLRYRAYKGGSSRRLYHEKGTRWTAGPGFAAQEPVELVVDFELDGGGNATGLTWKPAGEEPRTAERINRQEWVTFESGGVRLTGRIDLPDGPGPHPGIVLVHGSGNSTGTEFFYNGDFFAAHGIATLTYDKRGTGRSQGEFTFDFHQLARDALAAMELLASRPEIDPNRIGLSGYSQGGWVAPLAASMSEDVRYVLVSYGMIESSAEEARIETRALLRKRGVDERSLAKADELTRAAVHIVATDFQDGWEEFGAANRETKGEPWRKQLRGTTVGQFVKYPRWLIKRIGPRRALNGLPWYYDSTAVLDELSVPMIWMLGDSDESAPNEATIAKLRAYEAAGKPYELIVFQDADHGMLLFEESEGKRRYTGYAPDYAATEVAGARRLAGLE